MVLIELSLVEAIHVMGALRHVNSFMHDEILAAAHDEIQTKARAYGQLNSEELLAAEQQIIMTRRLSGEH